MHLKKYSFDLRSQERGFNRLVLCGTQVRKWTQETSKGEDEVFFYQSLKAPLNQYFPRFHSVKRDASSIEYQIDLINCYDVSKVYLNGELNNELFQELLIQLNSFFEICPKIKCSKENFRQKLHEVTVEKMLKRFEALKQMSFFNQLETYFWAKGYSLNAHKIDLQNALEEMIKKTTESELQFSHGDLCFSNILFDSNKELKLVDPRGGKTEAEFYLPPIYDFAKLAQCVVSNYDGILANHNPTFSTQQKIFFDWLADQGQIINDVLLVQSCLLLSLMPLHSSTLDLQIRFAEASIMALKSIRS